MSPPAPPERPLSTDRQLLQTLLDQSIRAIVTVPCSFTAGWHARASEADRSGELELLSTIDEGNLIALAAGSCFFGNKLLDPGGGFAGSGGTQA